MKTLVIIIALVIFSSAYSFSQDNSNLKDYSDNFSYWKISYLAGTSVYFESGFSSNSTLPIGYNGGMEIGYYPSGKTAFFMNFNAARLKPPKNYGYYSLSEDVIEFTIGPRFYLDNRKSLFVESAIGTYMFNQTHYGTANIEESDFYYTNSKSGFGFEIGCGKDFPLSNNMSFTLKTKLQNAFPDLQNSIYLGVYGALSFDNKNNSEKGKKSAPGKTFALTLLGGINNPGFFYNRRYDWGVNYGIECAFKTSPKIEYYVSVINNKIVRDINYYSLYNINNNIFEIATGPRFIFNLNKVSAFFETGIGLYDHYTTGGNSDEFQYTSGSALGMNFGSGILINLTKRAGLTARGKFNFLFSEKIDPASYFTVNTGVRVYL